MLKPSLRLLPFVLLASSVGCAANAKVIGGTKVPDTADNREILGVVETYRKAVEDRDTKKLLALTSKSYWEDAGTPSGADDYGFDGLREVLDTRFQKASQIRYSLKYMRVRQQANRAFVEVLIDASYTIETDGGQERLDKRDQNEMVLEYDGAHWLFISGM